VLRVALLVVRDRAEAEDVTRRALVNHRDLASAFAIAESLGPLTD
jgi:hypothetical protein